jgi:hypothetical protein
VLLDPSYGRLHANTRTDVPWAFRPSELSGHGLEVQAELPSFEHAGFEASFDATSTPFSELRLFGFRAGNGLDCSAECSECFNARRVQALALFVP